MLGEAFRQRLGAGAYEPVRDDAQERNNEAWPERDRAKRRERIPSSKRRPRDDRRAGATPPDPVFAPRSDPLAAESPWAT